MRVWAGCCAPNCLTRSEAGAFLRGTASTALKALFIPQWSHAFSPPRSSFISCARARAGGWLVGLRLCLDIRQASTGRGAGGGMGGGSACANRRRRESGVSQGRALPSVVRGCVRGGSEARRGASAGRSGAHRPVLVAHEAGGSCSLAGKIARAQVGVHGPAAGQLTAATLRDLAGDARMRAAACGRRSRRRARPLG